ncbi:hypothetical protein POTOM_029343 [Populus tomentosa]|uniref:PsbP C-terminal domain-containing protein n=1 Tax=Populus tomentosa TaxID=118781 RepID=A0A8X7ZCK9_POPTO|nr:hypothetical protein POTOM_029343 [Populus tomentosa]
MECSFCRRGLSFLVRAEQSTASSASHSQVRSGRRELIAASVIAPWVSMVNQTSPSSINLYGSVAAETKKGFLLATDRRMDTHFSSHLGGRSVLHVSRCLWQEVVIEGQDKVFKDVIEPLESVGVNMSPTVKQDLRDNGPPQQVAETLIKKVSATSRGKRGLLKKEQLADIYCAITVQHDADGKVYYAIESVAQAPNFTCHALHWQWHYVISCTHPIIQGLLLWFHNDIIKEIWNNWFAVITFSFILFNFSHLYSVLSHLPCKTRMLVKLQFSLFCLGTSLFQSCLRHVSFHHVFLPVSFFVLLFPFPFVEEHLISEALRM